MRCAARFTGFEGENHSRKSRVSVSLVPKRRPNERLSRSSTRVELDAGSRAESERPPEQPPAQKARKQSPKQPSGLFNLVREIVFGDAFGLKSDKTASGCFGGCSFSTFLLFTATHCKGKSPSIVMKVNNLVRLFASGCNTLQNP